MPGCVCIWELLARWAFVYSFSDLGLAWIMADGWDSNYLLTVLDNVLSTCQAYWNGKSFVYFGLYFPSHYADTVNAFAIILVTY
jgi:hypothetical protein